MSALNTNFDNDPFPVFTPRNIQQQIGRSPQPSNQVNNLIGQQQQLQNQLGLFRSPSNQLTASGNAASQSNLRNQFAAPSNDVNLNRQLMNMVQNFSLNPQQQGNAMNKMHLTGNSRTPPPPSTHQTSHHQMGSLGPQHHHQQQTPMLQQPNNLHMPMSAPTANNPGHHHHATSSSSAHRKLFTNLNANSQLNDIMLLSGAQLDNMSLGPPQSGQVGGPAPGPVNPAVPQFLPPDMEPSRTAPPDLSNVVHLKRSEAFFMNEELRSEILRKNLVTNSIPVQELAMQLPAQVKDYHNLVPLDSQQINIEHKSRTFGLQTISYKANHIKTNSVYYLKRILNFRYINQRCAEIVEAWKKIQHANICTLRDVFGTKEFNGEHSIVFVYDYHPGLETLQYRLYNNPNINLKGWANPYNLDGAARPFSAGKTLNGSRSLGLLPEHTVWDFVIQLSSIIRTIHSSNLACRIITPSRLLLDHKTRLRLSGVGIFDVIDFENNSLNPATLAEHQQEDLVQFGRLILALACNSLIAISKEHINTSIEIMNRTYSVDMRNVISYFMQPGLNASNGRVKQITDAIPFIGHRFYTSLDNAYTRGDVMENELSKEIENGRLFRLICKLNIVLDRQDDVQWGETGDRYMLKLFRDYVFHQVTPNGQPWVDLSHMISCLNKFDAGSSEKICLVSPDSQNIMIVSYAQLKKCFEKVFNEITANMNT